MEPDGVLIVWRSGNDEITEREPEKMSKLFFSTRLNRLSEGHDDDERLIEARKGNNR